MRILVVEDYEPLRSAVVQALREDGYAVDASADGEDGLWRLQGGNYDVAVLDWMLPGRDGLEILRRVRRDGVASGVLLLTAKDQVQDRVQGLDSGADDYLVKPFAMEELLARVRALVRRRYGKESPCLRVGTVELDTRDRSVRLAGEPIALTAKEYVLLEFLMMRAGEVVSRTEIWEHAYDDLAEPSSNVVDVYVGYLRKKLERDGRPRILHTRRGLGYLLAENDT